MRDLASTKQRYDALLPDMNERMRRLFAGAEAAAIGHGGIKAVAIATGLSEPTVAKGVKDLDAETLAPGRVRREGAGRKALVALDPELLVALDSLVEPTGRGDPMSLLRWTSKSLRKLAEELTRLGHQVSHAKVGQLLRGQGYRLQANKKTLEGGEHPDRDAQFAHINKEAEEHLASGQPAISVDTKKKELVGNYKNGGSEYRPTGKPTEVNVYDFVDKEVGRANPYGVYDIAENEAWVSVGTDHDTSAFAVESIRRWWYAMGKPLYGDAAYSLMIAADGGGSNGSRVRLWKLELQKLSNEIGLAITVCHYPPGTSKWNKIEHRLFSHISMNWRGRPLVSHEVIVELIAATTTKKGLKVRCELDKNTYPTGTKITKKEMTSINIERHDFHGEWNYSILPQG